jgi:signal transduction histidine kinase
VINSDVLLTTEALDALSSHIAVLDARGVVVLVNEAWRRFAASSDAPAAAECYVGTNYLAVCRDATRRGDEMAQSALSGIEEVLHGPREEFLLDYPCITAERERWFQMRVTRFDAGPERYLVVAHDDITAQKEQERAVQESVRLLRSVLDALPIGVWIMNADGRIVDGNPAGMRIWGGARYVGTQEFGEYKGWWLNSGKAIAPDEWAAVRAIRKGETSIDEEVEIERFDKTRRVILNSAIPLFDREHRISGAIVVNQDITARKRAEAEREELFAERERLRLEAQEANRVKDDFIATLSHELRTPVQSVLGWASILKRTGAGPQTSERAVSAIERNARIVAQLLDDTLEFSRVVAGKLTLHASDVDVVAIVGDVVESMRPTAIEKDVTVVAHETGGHAVVHGDPTRLQQIIWNLLSNAVKFTPAGGRIDVHTETGDEWVDVSVHDNGIGIALEFLPFVFDRFRQSQRSEKQTPKGLGLGLAIVKELVERHHGTIRADSAGEGRGATFVCRFPLVRPHGAASQR